MIVLPLRLRLQACHHFWKATTHWPPFHKPGVFPCIRHDSQHPVRCIIFVGAQCPKPGAWTFFAWLVAKKRWTNTTEWSIPCAVLNPKICHGVSGQSLTRCPLPELPQRRNFKTHPCQLGTSPTKNTRALQQYNCHQYCKQCHQTSTLESNGDEIFLGRWQNCSKAIFLRLLPRPRKSGTVPKQTSPRGTSLHGAPTLPPWGKLTPGITTGNKA